MKVGAIFFFLFKLFFIEVWFLYNVVLVSAIQQNESAIHVHEKWKSLSQVWLFVTPWTVAQQAPLSMECSRQEYRNRLSFLSPGDLPDPGIEPGSSALQADSLLPEALGSPYLYIYPLFGFPFYLGHHRTLDRVPVLYSMFSLIMYVIHSINSVEKATHSSILAWRIPVDRGAWWATVHGVAGVGHYWVINTFTYIHQ